MSDGLSETEPRAMARAILRYLEEHPDAKDTIDGIAQWWLLREWRERKLLDVRQAVSLLLSNELIVETRREGLAPYYRLNQSKHEEISKILNRD